MQQVSKRQDTFPMSLISKKALKAHLESEDLIQVSCITIIFQGTYIGSRPFKEVLKEEYFFRFSLYSIPQMDPLPGEGILLVFQRLKRFQRQKNFSNLLQIEESKWIFHKKKVFNFLFLETEDISQNLYNKRSAVGPQQQQSFFRSSED